MKKRIRSLVRKLGQRVGRKVVDEPRPAKTEGRKVTAKKLSKVNKEKKKGLESCVAMYLVAFVKAGVALAQIRLEKLYLDEWPTFEEYCAKKWQFSASRARQLILAASGVQNLEVATRGKGISLPANEGQARALLGLPPKGQVEVWLEAVEAAPNGRVTAKIVEEVAAKHRNLPIPGRREKVKMPKPILINSNDKDFRTLLEALPPEYQKGNVISIKLTPIIRNLMRVSVRQVNLGL